MATPVGSGAGAVARRLLLGMHPRFPSSCPVRNCRGSVSSPRHMSSQTNSRYSASRPFIEKRMVRQLSSNALICSKLISSGFSISIVIHPKHA